MSKAVQQGDLARAFVDARRRDVVLTEYPGAKPDTLADAYRIQDEAIELWPDLVIGWKLGRVPADQVDRYAAERLVGPIFASSVIEATGDPVPHVPILRGFAAVEAEILLRVARPISTVLSIAEAVEAVDRIRFGIEIASSPFVGINGDGPAVTASDFGNNFGLVLGPDLTGCPPEELATSLATLSIDGEVVGRGCAADMLDGPFGSLAFLSSALEARGKGLAEGQWISTGALTGVHPVSTGSLVVARFGERQSISCLTTGSLRR